MAAVQQSGAGAPFAEQGSRRTTFIDIAERSGISRGSISWPPYQRTGRPVPTTARLQVARRAASRTASPLNTRSPTWRLSAHVEPLAV
nr:TetR family transcriptional regulator [Mycolicibacterium moriokaense]